MRRDQPHLPRQWLFADPRLGNDLLPAIRRMPPGSGIVIRDNLPAKLKHDFLRSARARGLVVIKEAGGAVARVHDACELRRALVKGTPLIFVSALYPTRSHPGRPPLPRMRAATLARLSPRPLFALGGMDANKFQRIRRLGFYGWGGIDAWLKI